MTSVGQITDPDGYVIFPNSTFTNDTTTVLTGAETPIEDVFPNVQTPKAIARLMLKLPSLKKNRALAKLISKYA